MNRWVVQKGSEVLTLTDEKLRKQLRGNDLSGTELARREDRGDWAPLHDYPVFAEEVPHVGDPAATASRRQLMGFAAHAALFVIIGCILGWPWFLAFWGLGLAGHALRSAPAAQQLFGRPQLPARARTTTGDNAASLSGEQSAEESLRHDPYLDELDAAIRELKTVLDESPDNLPDPPDLERIRTAAREAHARRVALLDLVDTRLQTKLEGDLEQVRKDAGEAPDQRTAETFDAEARAIAERLAAMRGAFAAAERLRSRESALLHQLQGARLDLLSAGITDLPVAPALAPKLDRLRGELEAEAEVDSEMARARLAANRVTV
jgi:hypothetical protein